MNKVICHDIDGKLHKVNVNKLIFRPSVYGVLIEKGKILLLKQKIGYDFPGGGMELGETLEQTLKREFFEETGLRVKKKQLLDCASSFFYSKRLKKFYHTILIYYSCRKISGYLTNKHFDAHEEKYAIVPEWVDLKKIAKIKFQNAINSVKLIKKAIKLSNNAN